MGVMLNPDAARTVESRLLSRLVSTINCCVCGGFDSFGGTEGVVIPDRRPEEYPSYSLEEEVAIHFAKGKKHGMGLITATACNL
jgi:hypothetical protein